MFELIQQLSTSFILGVLTPLTAVCVLPLYPGFLAYLAERLTGGKGDKKTLAFLGVIITIGVVAFMFVLGIVFTTILQVSLTKIISIVSPAAFLILAVISLLLIFDIDIGKFIPKTTNPTFKNPILNAFIFGFFFGAIVIPCNPLFLAALFTKTISGANFLINMLNFVAFGIGIGAPLLFFSLISSAFSNIMIGFLMKYKRIINLLAGLAMLTVSLYYLLFVFKIF